MKLLINWCRYCTADRTLNRANPQRSQPKEKKTKVVMIDISYSRTAARLARLARFLHRRRWTTAIYVARVRHVIRAFNFLPSSNWTNQSHRSCSLRRSSGNLLSSGQDPPSPFFWEISNSNHHSFVNCMASRLSFLDLDSSLKDAPCQ